MLGGSRRSPYRWTRFHPHMYIKDRGENIGSTDSSTLDNISLKIREASTRGGQLLDLMGDLKLDFFKQDRILIDGIPIKIKMIPARDVFTLMTKSGVTEEYGQIPDKIYLCMVETKA